MAAALVRRSRSSDTAWMTARAASRPAGRDDRAAERHGRLADGGELDLVAAGALERPADAGRHPQRRVRGVHDRVDLEVADVPVPELDPRHATLHAGKRADPLGHGRAHGTPGAVGRDIAVTTSQLFVVRASRQVGGRDRAAPLLADAARTRRRR